MFSKTKLIGLLVFGLLMVGAILFLGTSIQREKEEEKTGPGGRPAPLAAGVDPDPKAAPPQVLAPPVAQAGLVAKDPDTPRQKNANGQALPFRTRTLPVDFAEKIAGSVVGSSFKLELFPDVHLEAKVLRRWEQGGSLRFAMALVGYPEQDYFYYSVSAGAGQGLVEIPSRNLAYEIRQKAGQSPEVREWLFTDRVCASPRPDGVSAERGSPRPSISTDPERGRAPRGIDPADVPALESRPGTPRVFYLDFDGETVSGTAWVNGGQILAPAAQMTPNQVRLVWERVCRDFDPFDVNITTVRSVYDAAPETSRIMCVVTANDAAAPGAGGVAYLESFEMDEASGKKICWAFIDDDAKSTAEVISHELGHTLSLTHDGREAFRGQPREEYYAGHGTGQTGWAPIMGVGYYQNLVQWSKGEYYRANNPEDDLAAINERLPYLPVVHGGTFPDATVVTNALSTGLIGDGLLLRATNGEVLVISNLPAGLHTVEVVPSRNGNVDARLEILLPNGSTNRNLNPPDFLGVKSFFSQAATTNLFFRISAAGRGEPADEFGKTGYKDGYSSYGSLGQYRLLYRRMVEFADEFSVTNPVGVRISQPLFTSYLVQGEDQLIRTNGTITTNREVRVTFGVTNIIVTETHFLTNVYSNNLITLHPNLVRTNGLVLVPLAGTNTNPLGQASLTGFLEGAASTNFVLALSNNLTVSASNRTVVRTNRLVVEHVTVITNNGDSTNIFHRQPSTNSFATFMSTNAPVLLTTFTNTNNLRLVFQRPALVTFTNTTMAASGTNLLPFTNSLGLAYGYRVLSAPGTGTLTNIGGTNALVSTNPLPALLEVSLRPTSPALEIWSSNARSFSILKTNPAVMAFAFVTNPTAVPTTATNLRFGQSTPLVVTNAGSSRVVFTVDSGGQIFFSNHPVTPNVRIPYFLATAGTLSSTVTATLAATATSAATSVDHVIQLTQAPSSIVMRGRFSNGVWTNTDPALTTIPLEAFSTAGARVDFSTTNPNLLVLNRNQLRMLAPGTGQVVATAVFQNTNNYVAASPVTNTVVVAWPLPSTAPDFASTNRRDGRVGEAYTHLLLARSNTNAFPVTFGATNLPPGLAFDGTNRIFGVPTQAGFFRMQVTASNAGGVGTNALTAAIAPATTFSVTNPWTFWVALGSGDGTNGSHTVSNLSAGIGTNATTPAGFLQPVLVLTNANTNPLSGIWFAGLTNLGVTFSNSLTNFTVSVPLNVRPGAPSLAWTGVVSGIVLRDLASAGMVTPAGLTNLPGYPLAYGATSLPEGLRINAINGAVTGQPLFAGRQTGQIWVSNAAGRSGTSADFAIAAIAGSPLQSSVKFTNALGTYSLSYLPPGLVLNPANGLIRGTAQAVGDFDMVVGFVRSGSTTTNSVTNRLSILPAAPILRMPTNLVTARTGQPFFFQPWVTGPGWGWAGADSLAENTVNTNSWTNRLLLGSDPVLLSSNSNGFIAPMPGRGWSLQTGQTNPTLVGFLWRSNLPSSWPWTASLRVRVSTNVATLSNQKVWPFLSSFLAPASTNISASTALAGQGSLASPEGNYGNVATNPPEEIVFDLDSPLARAAGQEIWLRLAFSPNQGGIFSFAYNTNLANLSAGEFVTLGSSTSPVLTNAGWSFSNPAAALRLAIGSSASNVLVGSNQIALSQFSVLPAALTFTASNLPAGLVCDPSTGMIYGTPSAIGTNIVSLRVSHPQGTNATNFTLRTTP